MREINKRFAPYSMEVIERILKAHAILKEEKPDLMDIKVGRIPLGSCDACRYIMGGYKAAGLVVIDGGMKKPRNWHSVNDTPENLEREVMRDILEICLNFVELVDKEHD